MKPFTRGDSTFVLLRTATCTERFYMSWFYPGIQFVITRQKPGARTRRKRSSTTTTTYIIRNYI